MAKKLKETYIHTDIHTYRQTDRLPLVVLSAAVAAKNPLLEVRLMIGRREGVVRASVIGLLVEELFLRLALGRM